MDKGRCRGQALGRGEATALFRLIGLRGLLQLQLRHTGTFLRDPYSTIS